MHSKRLRRRRLHAERAPKRRDTVDPESGEDEGNFVNIPVGGFTLTGPITLTLISTLPSTPTGSSTSVTSSSSTSQSTTSSSSSSTTSLTTSNAASQTLTSTSSSHPASTPVPSVILPQMTSAGISEQMNANSDLSENKLPAGGIAGIVIGCLVVLGVILFLLIRARSRRGRMRLRNTWTRNAPVGISSNSYEPTPFVGDSIPPGTSPEMRFAPPSTPRQFQSSSLMVNIPNGSTMSVPPAAYNNGDDIAPQSALSPRATRILSPTSVYSPTAATSSPSSATVVCTFIVTLPDELSIKVGETVRILAEYDDGWALCMNAEGEQGMVPVECLSRGRSGSLSASGLMPPTLDRDARGMRRVSSLVPSART